MIIKPYEIPLDVLQDEALNRRIPLNHPQKASIHANHLTSMAGQAGEREVAYLLQLLPENQFHIFHNLRLLDQKTPFQLDFLILTRILSPF